MRVFFSIFVILVSSSGVATAQDYWNRAKTSDVILWNANGTGHAHPHAVCRTFKGSDAKLVDLVRGDNKCEAAKIRFPHRYLCIKNNDPKSNQTKLIGDFRAYCECEPVCQN